MALVPLADAIRLLLQPGPSQFSPGSAFQAAAPLDPELQALLDSLTSAPQTSAPSIVPPANVLPLLMARAGQAPGSPVVLPPTLAASPLHVRDLWQQVTGRATSDQALTAGGSFTAPPGFRTVGRVSGAPVIQDASGRAFAFDPQSGRIAPAQPVGGAGRLAAIGDLPGPMSAPLAGRPGEGRAELEQGGGFEITSPSVPFAGGAPLALSGTPTLVPTPTSAGESPTLWSQLTPLQRELLLSADDAGGSPIFSAAQAGRAQTAPGADLLQSVADFLNTPQGHLFTAGGMPAVMPTIRDERFVSAWQQRQALANAFSPEDIAANPALAAQLQALDAQVRGSLPGARPPVPTGWTLVRESDTAPVRTVEDPSGAQWIWDMATGSLAPAPNPADGRRPTTPAPAGTTPPTSAGEPGDPLAALRAAIATRLAAQPAPASPPASAAATAPTPPAAQADATNPLQQALGALKTAKTGADVAKAALNFVPTETIATQAAGLGMTPEAFKDAVATFGAPEAGVTAEHAQQIAGLMKDFDVNSASLPGITPNEAGTFAAAEGPLTDSAIDGASQFGNGVAGGASALAAAPLGLVSGLVGPTGTAGMLTQAFQALLFALTANPFTFFIAPVVSAIMDAMGVGDDPHPGRTAARNAAQAFVTSDNLFDPVLWASNRHELQGALDQLGAESNGRVRWVPNPNGGGAIVGDDLSIPGLTGEGTQSDFGRQIQARFDLMDKAAGGDPQAQRDLTDLVQQGRTKVVARRVGAGPSVADIEADRQNARFGTRQDAQGNPLTAREQSAIDDMVAALGQGGPERFPGYNNVVKQYAEGNATLKPIYDAAQQRLQRLQDTGGLEGPAPGTPVPTDIAPSLQQASQADAGFPTTMTDQFGRPVHMDNGALVAGPGDTSGQTSGGAEAEAEARDEAERDRAVERRLRFRVPAPPGEPRGAARWLAAARARQRVPAGAPR